MADRNGVTLACRVSAANRPDICLPLATVVACPLPRYGEPGRMPVELLGDRGYDSQAREDLPRWIGVEPVRGRPGEPHGSGLGRDRYVVERTIAAVHQNRRLKVRYERRADVHQAFLTLACIKVCWHRLDPERK